MGAASIKAFKEGLAGELEKLRKELADLAAPLSEEQFWRKPLEPGNSVGHLVLHLTGNISHFAGARLGGTGYVRDRAKEFTDPAPPTKAEALARLDEAVALYRRVVMSLEDEALAAPHPDADRWPTVAASLVTLVSHFALHRGQTSYISRLVTRGTA
ncbi:MAG: DinB family protein [Gemmataceae bacterium]|nr:DinB family protein [Gemmataceae bacterium]